MASTVYDVKVRYALDDRASRGARNMAGEMDRAGRSALSLRGAIAGAGIAGAFMAGKRALIDFNSEIDQMKIGMTTILNMQLKKPWEEAAKSSEKLFVRFQELSKKSPATTKDFMTMANALTPVISSMGGGVDKIEKLTQGAVLAGLATGTRADVAALDVKQMLLGNVTERDMMANQLIASKGMSKEKFNDMSASARGAMVEEMLQDPALLRAADEFGKSFAGQVSTFKDQLQMALGTVGKPLMSSLTEEVKRWNTWIEKHPRTIAAISARVGGMLKNAFEFISKTAGWLYANREILFSIGKVFLAFKGAQMATNMIAGVSKGIGNFVDGLKRAKEGIGLAVGSTTGGGIVGSFKRMSGVLSAAGGVIPGLIGLGVAIWELWDSASKAKKLQEQDNPYYELAGGFASKVRRYGELHRGGFSPWNRGADIMGADGKPMDADLRDRKTNEWRSLANEINDPAAWAETIREWDKVMIQMNKDMDKDPMLKGMSKNVLFKDMDADYIKNNWIAWSESQMQDMKKSGKFDYMTDETSMAMMEMRRTLMDMPKEMVKEILLAAYPEQTGVPKDPQADPNATQWRDAGGGEKANINVTIHRIEVASDDPDRFVFGMVKQLNRMSKNPTQAASSIGD